MAKASRTNGKPRERTSNVSELADFAGVSRNTIYEWQKLAGYPKAGDGTVSKWELCEWYLSRLVSHESPGDSDETGGGDSPGLERLRNARAGQEEIKLAEMKKEFLSRDWVHQQLGDYAAILRGCCEQIQREYGEDAREIIEQAVLSFMKKIEQEWESQSET